jgi:hypothetical protein
VLDFCRGSFHEISHVGLPFGLRASDFVGGKILQPFYLGFSSAELLGSFCQ